MAKMDKIKFLSKITDNNGSPYIANSATGDGAIALGSGVSAEGGHSFATGAETSAKGYGSQAQNEGTIALRRAQTVSGRFNKEDPLNGTTNNLGKYAHIVGGGTSNSDRKNIATLDWEGNAWFAGNVDAPNIEALSRNADKVDSFAAEITNNSKRIENIEQGLMYDRTYTHSGVFHSYNFPSYTSQPIPLPYVELSKIGGMSYPSYNRLPNTYVGTPTTVNGVTFTPNEDGSVHITGTYTKKKHAVLTLCDDIRPYLKPGCAYSYHLVIEDHLDDPSTTFRDEGFGGYVGVQHPDDDDKDDITYTSSNGWSFDMSNWENYTIPLGIAIWYFNDESVSNNKLDITVKPIVFELIGNEYNSNMGRSPSKGWSPYSEGIFPTKVTSVSGGDTPFEIPDAVRNLEGYGVGINEALNNYIEWRPSNEVGEDKVVFVRNCSIRDYEAGDESLSDVVTDGVTKTVVALESPEVVDITEHFSADNFVSVKGVKQSNGGLISTITLNNESNNPVFGEIIYQS